MSNVPPAAWFRALRGRTSGRAGLHHPPGGHDPGRQGVAGETLPRLLPTQGSELATGVRRPAAKATAGRPSSSAQGNRIEVLPAWTAEPPSSQHADVLFEGPRRRAGTDQAESVATGPRAATGASAGGAEQAFEAVTEFCKDTSRRWDEPLAPRSSLARGCLATAIEVAKDPELRRRAAAEFEARTLANTSKPTYDSQLKAISRIAEAANFELLPITREKVAIIGGALKAANYKSANLYLVRYKRAHVEAGYAINDELLFVLRSAKRAAQRGTGATKKAAVFDVELVAQLEDCVDPVVTGGPLHPRRFVVMGTWWLLREIEASLIRINQVSLKADGVTVTLDLPVSKTDPDGRGFVRAHSCPAAGWAACGSQSCPACTVKAQVAARNAEGATADEPLFTVARGAAICLEHLNEWRDQFDTGQRAA